MRPLVPVALSFMLGIYAGERFAPGYGAVYAGLLVSLILLLAAALKRWSFSHFVNLPPFFLLGALFILPVIRPEIPDNHIKNFIDATDNPLGLRVEGRVHGPPEPRGDSGTRLYVDTEAVLTGDVRLPVTGRVMLTVKGAETGIKRGERVKFLSKLKEPRNFGNPGGFDYQRWLARKGVFVTGYVKEGFIVRTGTGGGGEGFLRKIDAARDRVGEFIDSSDMKHGGILKALTIGEKGTIPEETREVFIVAGTAHLLVISGLHVGFVAYFCYSLFLWILKRSERLMLAVNVKRAAALMSLLPVVTYGFIAGFPVSTQRAVIMVGTFVIMLFMGRVRDLYNTLALAALVVLLVSPGVLGEVSFQLSFIAVLAIIYLVPGLKALYARDEDEAISGGLSLWETRLRRKAVMLFFVSAAATAGTWPVLAHHFHRVSLVAPLSNLLIVPLFCFVTVPLALLSALFLPLWEGLSGV
ncbi:MAG: ComEC/Rec2 family competence protein, partial [Thermodesulfobacteriota bacterium]